MNTRDERTEGLGAKLPDEIPPARDLWPGIAARIAEEEIRMRARRRASAVIATIVTFAVAAAAILSYGVRKPLPEVTHFVAPSTTARTAAPRAFSKFPGEQGYEVATKALLEEFEAAPIPARERKVLDQNLTLIDNAIGSTRDALRADPEDVELETELDRAWEDKLDLLQQVAFASDI